MWLGQLLSNMNRYCILLLLTIVGFAFAFESAVDISVSIEGVWNIQVFDSSLKNKFEVSNEPQNLVVNLTRQNGQLIGLIANRQSSINILFQCLMSGLRTGDIFTLDQSSSSVDDDSDGEFEAGKNVLHFDFSNSTSRTFFSQGPWLGAGSSDSITSKPGFYSATLVDENLFTMNVWSQDGSEMIYVIATKQVVVNEPGLFAKYGPYVAFVVMFFLSRVLKTYLNPVERQGQPARAKKTQATKKLD